MSTIVDIFRKIPEEEGDQIFHDPYRFYAIAEDFAGGTEAENMKMLYYLAQNEILPVIGQACREADPVKKQESDQSGGAENTAGFLYGGADSPVFTAV